MLQFSVLVSVSFCPVHSCFGSFTKTALIASLIWVFEVWEVGFGKCLEGGSSSGGGNCGSHFI